MHDGHFSKCFEVFMDEFSMYGTSFEACLSNLEKVLHRCKETNLTLNLEKCHFMVQQSVVLGHVISNTGIDVDKAKVEVIERLLPPTNVKVIRYFSDIARPPLSFSPNMPRSCLLTITFKILTS